MRDGRAHLGQERDSFKIEMAQIRLEKPILFQSEPMPSLTRHSQSQRGNILGLRRCIPSSVFVHERDQMYSSWASLKRWAFWALQAKKGLP